MDNQLISRFVALTKERRDLEAQLDTVMQQLAEIQTTVLDQMTDAGVQRLTLDGMTVYVERKLWAKLKQGASKQDVIDALIQTGHETLVSETYNSNTLSALLRELDANGQPIPEPLAAVIETAEIYTAKARLA